METILDSTNLIHKFIHNDGSETAIKAVTSCDNIMDPERGIINVGNVDRNKYSVFISTSVGCYMKCNFCHLTLKNGKYKKLLSESIIDNVKDALTKSIESDPTLKTKYIKICWMGMGDAVSDPNMVKDVTITLLEWIFDKGFAIGLDGVDLATSLPPIKKDWVSVFTELNDTLSVYKINPNNNIIVHSGMHTNQSKYIQRSIFRVFYSLHSSEQNVRDVIIPKAESLLSAIPKLKEYSNDNTNNLILHYMFMDGVNDSPEQIDHLLNYIKSNSLEKYELRVLRYNPVEGSGITESARINDILLKISAELPFVKIQVSKGDDINAACGQFYTNFR